MQSLFFGQELSRFVFEHDRNIVLDRIGQPAGLANQFQLVLAVVKRALAHGADKDFKQAGVH